MRCRSCNQALWNLTTRVCPECATPFALSEFEFLPNAVQFCCPDCDQAYYGTMGNGHLEPAEFDCIGCGRHLHMNEMVLRPAEGSDGDDVTATMPWFDRERIGVVRAWFRTIWAAMITPRRLMARIPDQATIGGAWGFMYCSCLAFLTLGQILPFTIALLVAWIIGRNVGGPIIGIVRMVADMSLAQYMLIIPAYAVLPLLWVVLAHGLLRITGSAKVPMRRTAQAMLYAAAAAGPAMIPCLDNVGWIWWLVSAILMVQVAHACHGGRATFAVLTSAVIVGIVYTGFSAFASFGFGNVPFGPGGAAAAPASRIADTLIAAGGAGARTRHVAELIGDELSAADFLLPDTQTRLADVPFGDGTLADFASMPPGRQQIAAAAAGESLPSGTIAYRLGDFVMTHPGVTVPGTGDLWILVQVPDPDVNGTPGGAQPLYIAYDDGTTITARYNQMPLLLLEQNQSRAAGGLAPLPDPATVTHAAPAPSRP